MILFTGSLVFSGPGEQAVMTLGTLETSITKVLHFLSVRGFPGHGTFSAQTGKILGKLGQGVYLAWDPKAFRVGKHGGHSSAAWEGHPNLGGFKYLSRWPRHPHGAHSCG